MPSTQDCGAPPPAFPADRARELEPDAELLALWARLLALMAAGQDLYDEAFDPIGDEMTTIERRLATMTASTPAGVAVLLRVGLLRGSSSDELQERYLRGGADDDPPADLDPVLWRALVSIERQMGITGGCRGSSAPRRLTTWFQWRYRHVFHRQLRREARWHTRGTVGSQDN